MKKPTSRRRNISRPEDQIFSSRKKYFRINNTIYSLDKQSLDLISRISNRLRNSVKPEKAPNRRSELDRYFEQRD